MRLKFAFPKQKASLQPRLKDTIFGTLATWFASIGIDVSAKTLQTIFQITMLAVSAGLSIYNALASSSGKPSNNAAGQPLALDNNGQLVNSRQASDPVRVVYGIAKTGGTWVFSKVSALTNTILNNVVSWGEGEIQGLATAIDSSPIYTGSGMNDLETGGTFQYAGCSCDSTCYAYSPCSCNMTCYVYN